MNVRPQRQTNIDRAIKVYRYILRIEPSNTEAVQRLAEIYIDVDFPGEAEFICEKYLKEYSSSNIQKLLAQVSIKQHNFRRAANLLKIVIDKNPHDISVAVFQQGVPEDMLFFPELFLSSSSGPNYP